MVSLGNRSLWRGNPKSRSRRASDGDNENSRFHGVAVRAPDEDTVNRPAPIPPPPAVVAAAIDDEDDEKDQSEKDDEDDKTSSTTTSSTTTSSSQKSTTSQTSPTLVPFTLTTPFTTSTTLLSTTLTTVTPAATTILLTQSELSTITSIQTTTAVTAFPITTPSATLSPTPSPVPTSIFRGQSGDDCCHDKHHGPPPNNNKFAIAFGTIGGLGLVVGFLWLAFFIYRRRKTHGQDRHSQHEYGSSIGKPSRTHFKWPFGRSRYGTDVDQRQANSLPGGLRRSNTSIMDEAMRGAYGSDSSSLHSSPHGYLDEKRQDPNYPIPVLEPAAIQQANLRRSIASWFRRSDSNHPLKLNPSSRWSRSSARSSSGGLDGRTTTKGDASYSVSIYSASAGNSPPPMPELDLQRTYVAAAAVELPAPLPPVYASHDDTEPPASFVSPLSASRWSRSTSGGHERMSSVSSRTDATQTTISGGRVSVPAVPPMTGLSPPGFHRAGSSRDHGTISETDTAELTSLRQELLELYTQGARPASAVGVKTHGEESNQ